MSALPPEILLEFQKGNFVVKRSDRRFNQVSADESTEWLNATGKKSGGLVGITRIAASLSRWTLSYNLRTVIASQTKAMLRLTTDDEDDEYTHTECTKSRMERDDGDESKICVSLKEHCVFQDGGDTLKNIINKDVVTPEIQESLLGEHLEQAQMKVFVDKRLCEPPDSDQHLGLKSPIRKNKAKTFASLYEVVQLSKNKQNTIKVDRQILQRLVTVYRAGHKADLENVLQHELMPIPPSLAATNGSLHSTNKSVLANILTKHVQTPADVPLQEPSCLAIDGQALVMALGKPPDTTTFGDYANKFAETVLKMGEK
ncbi:glycoprotein [Dissostichus eleginoides]|uniref:Glycoprotein n=1 Tax=Dissostichus eleginoides TaxID=100907 RepID=A0AAD9C6I5_DISEL|nr:glycoprotein [Dissostichus eleginoides]